jgi:hypothetical protein
LLFGLHGVWGDPLVPTLDLLELRGERQQPTLGVGAAE